MEIEFTNSLGDLLSFNFTHTRKNRVFQMLVLIIVFANLYTAFSLKGGLVFKMTMFAILMAFFFLFVSSVLVVSALMNYKKSRNKTIFCRHKLSLSSKGISEVTEYSQVQFSWEAVNRIVQNKRLIMIYVQSNAAFLVPKRIFSSVNEANAFVSSALSIWRQALSASDKEPASPQ